MRLTSLMFLAIMCVVAVSECKPLSNDVEKTPCVDCKEANLRKKRSLQLILTETIKKFQFTLGCHSCIQGIYAIAHQMPVYRSPDIYIGNGQNNENHVVINGANNVYIGNGAHNTNYITYG